MIRHGESPYLEVQEISFANEKAKIAWEIGQKVSGLAAILPAETPNMDAKTIYFDSADRTRGTYAVFLTGTVVGTAEVGVFVVPERTLTILRKLGIPYHERVGGLI